MLIFMLELARLLLYIHNMNTEMPLFKVHLVLNRVGKVTLKMYCDTGTNYL